MLKDILKGLIIRDLEKLKEEVLAYQNEEKLWLIDKAILNSAGNLCLHLIGNLNTYIGAQIGKTGYERNREAEFSLKNIPREELIIQLDKTIVMIAQTFDQLTDEKLIEIYPGESHFKEVTTQHFFIHLAMHLAYHLGQVNYHRRLIDN
ncbi:MAG: DinB family protein [Pedobacter sp.]|nr:MAG: DinB family protein [Pedobacter sp.]